MPAIQTWPDSTYLPLNCDHGDIVVNQTGTFTCTAADTWTPMGAGGSGEPESHPEQTFFLGLAVVFSIGLLCGAAGLAIVLEWWTRRRGG